MANRALPSSATDEAHEVGHMVRLGLRHDPMAQIENVRASRTDSSTCRASRSSAAPPATSAIGSRLPWVAILADISDPATPSSAPVSSATAFTPVCSAYAATATPANLGKPMIGTKGWRSRNLATIRRVGSITWRWNNSGESTPAQLSNKHQDLRAGIDLRREVLDRAGHQHVDQPREQGGRAWAIMRIRAKSFDTPPSTI